LKCYYADQGEDKWIGVNKGKDACPDLDILRGKITN